MAKIAAIVLAAGASARHPSGDKLMRPYKERPLALHALNMCRSGRFARRLVVVADEKGAVAALARAQGFDVILNARAREGMGGSLAAGVAAARDCDAAAVFLADMPEISIKTIERLVSAFSESPAAAVYPTFKGRRGHPVIFSRGRFSALMALAGGEGAAKILAGDADARALEVDDPGILFDLDRESDFEQAGAGPLARAPDQS